jgi:regulatory protein
MDEGGGRLDLPGASMESARASEAQASESRALRHLENGSSSAPGERLHNAAIAAACKILSVRARTEKELRDSLAKKGFSPVHIDDAVAEMIRRGYIDDVDAANRWASSCVEERRYGARGIALRLVRRGIDPDLADRAARLAYEAAGLQEFEVALELAERRVGTEEFTNDDSRRRAVRRVAGLLARRGFGTEAIARVVRELSGDAI